MKISVKPMAGPSTSRQEYELAPTDDVSILREKVAEALNRPSADIKLIFKGRFLKDGMDIESVRGLTDGMMVHAMCSNAQAKPLPGAAAGGVGDDHEHEHETSGHPTGTGMTDIPLSDMIRAATRGLPGGDNPEVQNEVRQLMQDPEMMRQMMQIANNPQMRLEYMRSMDRALNNIESVPGGFNALASMMGRLDEGTAATEAEEEERGASRPPVNPFDRLFAVYSSSSDPMPNPWQRGGEGGGMDGWNLGGDPMGGLGALMSQLGSISEGEREQLARSMQETLRQLAPGLAENMPGQAGNMPSLEDMMGELGAITRLTDMRDDELVREAANMRERMQETMRRLPPGMIPEEYRNIPDHAMEQMMRDLRDVARRIQRGDMGALRGLDPMGILNGSSDGLGELLGDGSDTSRLQTVLNTMGGLGIGGGQGGGGAAGGQAGILGRQLQPISEGELAEKNLQLQSMGFVNEDANRRALQLTNGNVNAAVEILLSSPPSL